MRITFCRRSRVYPGVWLKPETVTLPKEGAELFLKTARQSPDYHIMRVQVIRCR